MNPPNDKAWYYQETKGDPEYDNLYILDKATACNMKFMTADGQTIGFDALLFNPDITLLPGLITHYETLAEKYPLIHGFQLKVLQTVVSNLMTNVPPGHVVGSNKVTFLPQGKEATSSVPLLTKVTGSAPTANLMLFPTTAGHSGQVQFLPRRLFTLEQADYLWPVGVAAFDPSKWVAYIAPLHVHASHGDLIHLFELENTFEDDKITGEVIYGFVTASGHFLNRAETAYWLQSKFPELIKKPIEDDRLNSSNIDWGKVIAKVKALRCPQ